MKALVAYWTGVLSVWALFGLALLILRRKK
jgi:hypothetical protein